MLLSAMIAVAGAPAPVAEAADWSVKKLRFSAITIGVGMQDAQVGWSSFTDGSSGIKITKTTDGGATWTPVKEQSKTLMVMGMDAATHPALDVVTTGMAATSYSADGDTFSGSKGGPFVSQSIQANAAGVVTASDEGVCVSADAGATYKCHAVPFKYGKLGRYAAMPSKDVIYVTAGMWPSQAKPTAAKVDLSAKLRVVRHGFDALAGAPERLALEMGPFPDVRYVSNSSGYKAELWKSSDGGATWKNLVADEGAFYFNQIDCLDETHCVAVGEGFGHDGSTSPGARVYVTTDGETFKLAHHETVDGSSLMAAKMLSATEHHAGGVLQGGVALHTTDGGATYTKQGASIKGQMITDMSFTSPTHALATSVNQLQISSLLEYAPKA
jgi:photosystem II stability/assembly factor-like uncharacterized protein